MFSNVLHHLRCQNAFEFLSTPTFWVVGIFLALHGHWVNQQVIRFTLPEAGAKDRSKQSVDSEIKSFSSESAPSPKSVFQREYQQGIFWIQPWMTTGLRKAIAILACGLILPLQILEGSWVLQTSYRVSVATHKATYLGEQPFLIRYAAYFPGLVIGLLAWMAVLWTGAFLLVGQLTLLALLIDAKPGYKSLSKHSSTASTPTAVEHIQRSRNDG
jgi:hypothetical protein